MANNEDEIRHISVLLEQVIEQNERVLEAVEQTQESASKIPHIEETVTSIKGDLATVKAAVTATNNDLHQLENRVLSLET
jgi:capsule polysaccharide export protein KpsE/RkpR